MDSMILTLALSIIRSVVKNPQRRAKLRDVMLQIRDAIDASFGVE